MGAGSEIQQNEVAGVKPMTAVVKASKKPVVVLTQGLTADGNGQWKASLMASQNDFGVSKIMSMLNGGTVSPIRSSKRNAANSD
jgi:hypothetical protein